jgi:quercetin dioxygenase-like cupin family protein
MDHAHVVPPDGGAPWNVGGEIIICKADLQLVEPHLQVFIIDGTRGSAVPSQRHPWDEIVVVLEGELELRTGSEVHVVGRGAVGVAPAGSMHGVRTVSETSRYIVITSTDQAAGLFADLHDTGALRERPGDG